MAHFAQLDENNTVIQVIVISNADILDENGVEQETLGISVCQAITGGGTWVQTSYNGNFRKQYAGIGDKYVAEEDLFYNPNSPFPSWTLDAHYNWVAPIPKPEGAYAWNEETQTWDELAIGDPNGN